MKAIELLQKAMRDIGADGLYTRYGLSDEETCGCGIDNLAPCVENPFECVLAKKIGDKFYPMET